MDRETQRHDGGAMGLMRGAGNAPGDGARARHAIARVAEIVILIDQALELADEVDEFMLGAKLSELQHSAQARLAEMRRQD